VREGGSKIRGASNFEGGRLSYVWGEDKKHPDKPGKKERYHKAIRTMDGVDLHRKAKFFCEENGSLINMNPGKRGDWGVARKRRELREEERPEGRVYQVGVVPGAGR